MKHIKELVPNNTKYDVLKWFSSNREHGVRDDLVQSIKDNGFTDPIKVIKYTGNLLPNGLYIGDGQNRLDAAKSIKHPYDYYIVCESDNELEISLLIISWNSLGKSWTMKDYANHFSNYMIGSYSLLLTLHKQYKISLTTLVKMLKNDYGIRAKNILKRGKFEATHKQLTQNMIDEIIELKKIGHKDLRMTERQNVGFAKFYTSLEGKYNRKKMIDSIRFARKLPRCSEQSDAKKMFEKLYGK